MKKFILAVVAMSFVAIFLVSCGESTKTAVVPATSSVAFLQQKPSSNLLYPVLGTFSGNQFTTKMIKDPSTGQYVSAAIGSIILNAKGDKAALEVFGGTNNSNPTNQWDIYIGSVDGANLVQVTNDSYPDEVPQFNPAGTKVVYSSERTVEGTPYWLTVVRNADGTGEQVLPLPAGAAYTWHASYSPDGSKIAVEAYSDVPGATYDGIFIMNADGSNPVMLTNPYSADCWCWDEDPFFTSDGSHIVFSRENGSTLTEDVYVMKSDGTAVTKLTDGTGYNFDPLVLHDASTKADRILFSSNRDSLNTGSVGFELYTMNTDGSGLTRLTNNGLYDGFNLEFYESSGASAALAQPHRRGWTAAPPEHRLSW